jgi:hypothetical protein
VAPGTVTVLNQSDIQCGLRFSRAAISAILRAIIKQILKGWAFFAAFCEQNGGRQNEKNGEINPPFFNGVSESPI